MNYLLSIIIPTKNRASFCLFAVRQILSLDLPNVEICIQDNSDTNDLKQDILALGGNNVVYNYHPGVLSFVDNFSEAVSISHGEYVCMIGDDDGVLPCIMKYVNKAKSEDLDALIPSLGCIFIWPSKEKIVNNAENGLLHIWVNEPDIRCVNPQKALNKLLHNAVQNYTALDIPRLYHGLVKREVLESIKEKTGVFFGGLTPDMYMAGALALECKKVIRISDSITISGICPTSGSADSATGKHTGELSDAPHFNGHDNYIWDNRIPAFYSVDTIWAETLIHVLLAFNRDDLVDKLNYPLFESICIHKYPGFKQLIYDHSKRQRLSLLKIKYAYPLFYLKDFSNRLVRRLKREFHSLLGHKTYSAHLCNISDIIEAELAIENFKRHVNRVHINEY